MNEELQGIVEKMIAAGESEEDIALVIREYKPLYDYKTAKAAGLGPDEEGHWPSRDPRTGKILKSPDHPTFAKTLEGEEAAGYEVYQNEKGEYYSRPKATDPSLGDIVGAGVGAFNRGAASLVTEPLKLGGAIQRTIAGSLGYPENVPLPLVGGNLEQLGEQADKFVKEVNPYYENVSDTGQALGEGLGQAFGMVGAGMASAGGKVLAPATQATGRVLKGAAEQMSTPVGFLGGTVTAVPEWEAAKAAGMSDEDAFATMVKNYFVGQTDAIPISNFLSRFDRITGGALLDRVKNYGMSGLQEFVQEGFQTYLTNQIAKSDYDPDRDPMFQVLESAQIGGMVGLLFPVMGRVMAGAPPKVREKLEQKAVMMEADKAVADMDTGDPAVNATIDNQAGEATNTDEQTAEPGELEGQLPPTGEKPVAPSTPSTEVDPVTLTETTFPVYDEQGNDTGKTKKAHQFTITLPGIGDAKGTIVGDKASILEIFAEKDAEGNAKRGGGLYGKVIENLKRKGVKQIVVGLQSPASTAALQGMVRKGTLSVAPGSIDAGETDMQGNPIRFNIESDLVTEFDQTGALLGGAEESRAATKSAATEQIADFLRGKVKSRGEVTDFADNWNLKHPERQITDAEVKTAWDLIRVPKPSKGETTTLPINELLKDQIKTFYRGVEKGVRKGQKMVNEQLISKVQEALKTAKLSPRQTSAILTRLKGANLFTPGSVSKLNTFIDKVVNDAQYAEKLAKGKSLQKRVKKFGRQKSDIHGVATKVLAENFGRINPSEVQDIDEYIEKASAMIAAFRPASSPDYAAVDAEEAQDYIDKRVSEQESEQEKELTEVSEKETTLEVLRERASLSAERLQGKDLSAFDEASKKKIEVIKKVDTSQLDEGFLARYIKTVDNIVTNDDLSNEAFIEALGASQDFIAKWEQKIGKVKTSKVGLWGRVFNNISNMWKRIYQDQSMETFLRTYYQKLAVAGSQREVAFQKADKALDDVIKNIKDKHKTDVRTLQNQIDFQVFSLLVQMQNPTEITKMHRNIRATIDRHTKAGNQEEAEAWQKAYESYTEVTTAEEAQTIVEKKNPAAKELWDFFRGIFNDQLAAEQSQTAREVYNKKYTRIKNYLPIVQHHTNTLYRRLGKMEEGTPDLKPSVDPQQARTAMRRSLNLMDKQAVYTSTPLNDLILRYSETIYDNLAAREEMKLLALLRNAKTEQLVGGKENYEATIKAFDRFLSIQRGLHGSKTDSEVEELFTETAKSVRHIGTVRALASVSQVVKQSTVSVKTWFNLMTTGDADLMVPAIHAVSSIGNNKDHPVKKLLENSTLVARSLRMGGTDRGTSEAYKLQRGARRNFLRFVEKTRIKIDKNVRNSLGFLTRPDVFNARMAFVAYYMKSLRDQGLKNDIDLNTEWQKQDTPERKTAIAFAETMIEKTQAASNAALLSEFQAKASSNWGEFVKTVFLPFSTFDADFKARLVNEVSAVRRNGTSEDIVRLGGTIGEAMVFSLMSGLVVYWWKELIKKGVEFVTGAEPPEKEEEKSTKVLGVDLSHKSMTQRTLSSFTSSINPLAVGTIPQDFQAKIINDIGFIIAQEENPELTKKEWMKENALVFEAREGGMFENLGVYSSGFSPLLELWKDVPRAASIFGEPVSVVDGYGNEKQVRLSEDQQKVLVLKMIAEFTTIAGMTEADVANAVRQVYREQLRAAKSDSSPARKSTKSFKRKQKTFKRQ